MQLFNAPPQTQPTVAIPQDRPTYRVGEEKFYADDRLFETGQIIIWDDEPSLSLEPLNEPARKAKLALAERLDKEGRKAAAKAGVAYVGYADAMKNAMRLAQMDAKRVTVLNESTQQNILGTPMSASRAEVLQPEQTIEIAEVVPGGRVAVNKISEPEFKDKG